MDAGQNNNNKIEPMAINDITYVLECYSAYLIEGENGYIKR